MKDKNRYAKNICILVLGIVSLVLLCLLAKNYNLLFLQKIDTKILQFMVEHTNECMTVVMNVITFFGTKKAIKVTESTMEMELCPLTKLYPSANVK